jgi:ADP-ribose pyrophosphatase
MDDNSLEWQPFEHKTIFSTRIFDINEIHSRSPDKDCCTFYSLHATDWVIVIPVLRDEKERESFLMVRQWRHGSEQLSVEFPGGVMDAGETPAQAAERELLEETGFQAGSLEHAATFSPNPAIMDNHCHIFIAKNLKNTNMLDLDDDEYVQAKAIPAHEVIENMGHGDYIHGLMSAALFIYIHKTWITRKIDNLVVNIETTYFRKIPNASR